MKKEQFSNNRKAIIEKIKAERSNEEKKDKLSGVIRKVMELSSASPKRMEMNRLTSKNVEKNRLGAKRMKKTVPTIFITDDSKENVSLIKKREVSKKNKKSKGFFIKVIKKNQIIMFASALCLISVGYLAYNPMEETNFVSTTLDNSTLADIGDATFVSSQKIVEEVEKSSKNNRKNSNSDTMNGETIPENNTQKNTENTDVNGNTKDDVSKNSEANANVNQKEGNDNGVATNAQAIVQKEKNDYFVNSKIDREKMYSQMLESYQKILDNQTVSGEQKAIAAQEIAKINNQKNSIMIAENLIKTKGLEDVVIFINLDSISVIVKADVLTKEQIAQIQNIITRELNTEIANVHISTK